MMPRVFETILVAACDTVTHATHERKQNDDMTMWMVPAVGAGRITELDQVASIS